MESFCSARFFSRWFVRSLGVAAPALLMAAGGQFVLFVYIFFFVPRTFCELSDLRGDVCRYQDAHWGEPPESLQEVYASGVSLKQFRGDVDDYMFVPKSISFPTYCGPSDSHAWVIATKRPHLTFFPCPYAAICYTTMEVEYSDSPLDVSDGCYSLSPSESRSFSAWLAQRGEAFNLANKKRLLDDYFVPLVVDAAVLLLLFLAVIVHVVRAVGRERVVRKELQTSCSAILKFRAIRQRDPRSEHEVRAALPSEPFGVGLATPFRYVGNLNVKYRGQKILVITRKTRLSPFFPLFGGKRLLLLLENGAVVKVWGSLSTDRVLDAIKVAEKLFLPYDDSRTSKTFFKDDISRERHDLTEEKETSLTPETERVLSIKNGLFTKLTQILLPPAIILTFLTAFAFSALLLISCCQFGSDLSPLGILELGKTVIDVVAYCLLFGFPYFYVVFNYYAEY